MAVEVWIGEKPEHPNERRALIALANGLERLDEHYLMLANFSVGGNTIDLVIVKHDAIFIIELKYCDGKVFGSVNGQWTAVNRGGSSKVLNPGRKNPYNQVIAYAHSFTNFLYERRHEFLSDQKARTINFRVAKRVVALAPSIQEGSEIEVDWKVTVKGLDELPTYLVTERSNELNFSDAEMRAIPAMLHCVPWQEVNDLVHEGGVMPAWDDTPADPPPPEPPAAREQPAETAEDQAAVWPWLNPPRTIALYSTIVAMILLVVLALVLPPGEPPVGIETPTIPGASIPVPTGARPTPSGCLTQTVGQSVAKRLPQGSGSWVLDRDNPQVVVYLEKVVFCDTQVQIHWTLQNFFDNKDITMALTEDNIGVIDNTNQAYLIDESLSAPPQIVALPGQIGKGVTVIQGSINGTAQAITISLKKSPFSTIWPVTIPR